MGRRKFLKGLSISLTALFIGTNLVAVSSDAAEPSVQVDVQRDTEGASEKIAVSGLDITGLNKPQEGKALDGEATINTVEGVSWKIPVVWVDDKGEIASFYDKGKKCFPAFVFYLPEGVVIESEDDFSIKLPEFVGDICGEKGMISVVEPSSGIIYLTAAELAETGGDRSYTLFDLRAFEGAGQYRDTYISKRDFDWEELASRGIDSQAVQQWLGAQNNQYDVYSQYTQSQGDLSVQQWANSQNGQNDQYAQYMQSQSNSLVQQWLNSQNNQYAGYSQYTQFQSDVSLQQWTNAQNSQNDQYAQYMQSQSDSLVQQWLNAQNNQYAGYSQYTQSQSDTSAQQWLNAQNNNDDRYSQYGQYAQYQSDSLIQQWLNAQGYQNSRYSQYAQYTQYQPDAAVQQWSDLYNYQGNSAQQNIAQESSQITNTENSTAQTSSADLVSIHCTSGAIETIGRENLQNLIHLIRDVIEPQAVYQLTTKFDSFATAAQNGELGESIGLYIYNSSVDSTDDVKNMGKAYAYTLVKATGDKMEYFIGVDTNSFYHLQDGSYVLNDGAFDELSNTLTHELMHAFMYDYTRPGMIGRPDHSNDFPKWFSEGMATVVDEGYSYQRDYYAMMQVGRTPYSTGDYLTGYTDQSVLSFFNGGVDLSSYGSPRLTNSEGSQASGLYVSGYLACVYLGAMAATGAGLEVASSTGSGVKYNSDAIRGGLDIILTKLHEGTSLDDVIREVSNGSYDGIDDFEEKFLLGSSSGGSYVSQDSESLDFCVGYLNYLNDVSAELTTASNSLVLATGSLLLPLDSTDRSAIKEQNPDGMPQQLVYKIIDSDDWVESTVDVRTALASAGSYETGTGEDYDDRIAMAARFDEQMEIQGTEDTDDQNYAEMPDYSMIIELLNSSEDFEQEDQDMIDD